jgi:hypothetical protein
MRNGGRVEVHKDTPVMGLSTNGTGWEVRLLDIWGLGHMYVYCHCTGVVVCVFLSYSLNPVNESTDVCAIDFFNTDSTGGRHHQS